MHNVIIIGAGQIGSRHLQAIKKSGYALNIDVVDISETSLIKAKTRYEEIKENTFTHNINYHTSFEDIRDYYDVVIIATSSTVRFDILNKFFTKSSAKYMILEKIIFDRPIQYHQTFELLKQNNCTCWVNCPMRMWDSYQPIFKIFSKEKIYFNITGVYFNLMSNAIHYIDVISNIIANTNYVLDSSNLIPEYIPSKRQGFYELCGKISIKFDDGSNGSIHCINDKKSHVMIHLFNGNDEMFIDETNRISFRLNNNEWIKQNFEIPYQSDLTNLIINDLLRNGNCRLTPYEESMNLHLNFITPLLEFIRNHIDFKCDRVPFT